MVTYEPNRAGPSGGVIGGPAPNPTLSGMEIYSPYRASHSTRDLYNSYIGVSAPNPYNPYVGVSAPNPYNPFVTVSAPNPYNPAVSVPNPYSPYAGVSAPNLFNPYVSVSALNPYSPYVGPSALNPYSPYVGVSAPYSYDTYQGHSSEDVETEEIKPLVDTTPSIKEEESGKEKDHKTIYKREISINWPGLRQYHCIESIEENDLDLDQGNRIRCQACSLPIFSTPYDSRHFLHNCCVQLPIELKEHSLHFQRPLILHQVHELPDSDHPNCDFCHRKCGDFFYRCPAHDCKFTLDVSCTRNIKIVHRSHQHELLHIHGTEATANLFVCGACGSKHDKGDFYWCNFCDFYLHQDCALLPNFILLDEHRDINGQPEHHLCLTFVVPKKSLKFRKSNRCSICDEEISSIKSGMYFCTRCEYSAHVKCATRKPTHFEPVSCEKAVGSLIHLPMRDEHASLLACLLESRNSSSKNGTPDTLQKMHGHDLILHDNYGDELSEISSCLCDACIRPISPPFYSCKQCSNFYLHNYCDNLPSKYQHPAHEHGEDHQTTKSVPSLSGKFSSFYCQGCLLLQTGFVYNCADCSFNVDVECALLPEAITHGAHGKSHILFLSDNRQDQSPNICHCCNKFMYNLFYECCSCPNFKLDVRCALLPLTVSHRFDRHPLELTFYRISTPKDDVDFCEICEKSIGTRSWFYHCKECATLFHIDCIPCVGELSKIKFGSSYITKFHNCPMACVRLLESHSYTCGICEKTIQGKEEGIAYVCTKCCFWVHAYCCAKREGDVTN